MCRTMQSSIEARCPCESPLQAASAQGSSVAGQLTEQELFSRLHKHHDWQESHMGEFSVLRTYTMRKENDVASAQEIVNMKYSPPGKETFTIVSAKGSRFIRTHVFQRLMDREIARTRERSGSDGLITPENYRLVITGKEEVGSTKCIVVHASPRQKKPDSSSKGTFGSTARILQSLKLKVISRRLHHSGLKELNLNVNTRKLADSSFS